MPPRARRTSARPLARCAQVFMILGDYGAHEISRWEQVRASVAGPRAMMMRCRVGRGAVALQLSKKIVLMSATSAVDSGGAAARDGAGKSIFTRMSECDPTQRLGDADGGEEKAHEEEKFEKVARLTELYDRQTAAKCSKACTSLTVRPRSHPRTNPRAHKRHARVPLSQFCTHVRTRAHAHADTSPQRVGRAEGSHGPHQHTARLSCFASRCAAD